MYNIEHNRNKGLIGTVIFHTILIILLIFWGFSTPLPLPGEEGILINFGDASTGKGVSQSSFTPPPTPKKEIKKPVEEVKAKEILTQDYEESVAIESKKEKKKTSKDSKKENKSENNTKTKETKKEIKEEDKKEKKKVNINALYPGKKDKKGDSEGQGNSKGDTNQGNSTENKTESNSTKGGTGLGTKGISFSLAGRQPQHLEQPEYVKQVEGKVVVEVTVDRDGNVTQATAGAKGSTTLNSYLLQVAKTAALKTKFNRKPNSPVYQKGTITYNFLLQ